VNHTYYFSQSNRSPVNRGSTLLLAALVLAAGCTAPSERTVRAEAEQLDDAALVEGTTVPANRTIPAVRAAVRTGSSNTTDREDTVGETEAVVADGSYYTVNRSLVAERPATSVTYRVRTVAGGSGDYSLAELSPEDRPVLVRGQFLADESDDGTLEGAVYENGTELERSVLASETPVVVAFNGTLYRVEEVGREATTQPRYSYTAERVAASEEGYLEYLEGTYVVALDGLSAQERSFVENVTNNGSYSGVGGEGYVELRDRLRDRPTVDQDTWLVRYEGRLYRFSVAPESVLP